MNHPTSNPFRHGYAILLKGLLAWLFMLAYANSAFALSVSPSSVLIPVGATATVTVTGTQGNVKAASSNTAVATVTYASGLATITGVSAGTATVTITNRGQSSLVSVTVRTPLSVSPTSVTIPVNGSANITVSNAIGTVSATSSNAGIASVTYAAGIATIHGNAAGSATITIADSFNSRTVSVTVLPALSVSPTSVTVPVGGNANVTVSNAFGTVTASSSNTAIATVTYASGVATIHGVSAGSATVTISDSINSRTVAVTVTAALTVSPTSVSVPVNGNATVSVTNATGTVTASSSNTAIATVTYAAGVATIHGVAVGSATVTISDSLTSRTVAVTVTAGLTVSPTSVSVPVGGNATVSVTNATGTVTATSSNTAVATVTYASGIATIHGVAAGSATVTISDSINSRTVAVTATSGLTVSPTSVSVAVGGNATVSVTNATGTVTASSSNTAIATVTYASGVATIHGVAAGSATVTISDSLASRTVAVTVSTSVLTISRTSVTIPVGGSATVNVTNATGTVTATSSNTAIATVTYASGTATIQGVAIGSATVAISDTLTTRTVAVTVSADTYSLLAWNNLGMHCIDGQDYSAFSILPPLNVLNAQLVNQSLGTTVTSGVTLTYQAVADASGSINTISSTKTNFWQYAPALFGLSPAPDVGLLGYPMASLTPAAMAYNSTNNWFEAVGIPITPTDDTRNTNFYPMVQVVAKNTAGQVLATTKVVLPVSDEITCVACHGSTTSTNTAANAAKPAAGWVFNPDPLKDWKLNILRLHDEKQTGNATYASALTAKNYPNGLYNSATAGRPVLCVACHLSNAYQIDAGFPTGITGISALTKAQHASHATAVDPATGITLDNTSNRSACYMCHPGSVTQCLRGAMSSVKDTSGNLVINCQSCHGKMSNVGTATRSGWLTEPNCQACHHDSKRELSAVDTSGNLLTWTDTHFATVPNRPSAGFSLYRFSTGHGNLECSACHGSTHAEFPTDELVNPNDNVQSIGLQGYAGVVHECTVCHTTVPTTTTGGPHGMHTIGSSWVSSHQSVADSNSAPCAYCHGADFRGSFLSQVKVAKTVGSHTYTAGQVVSCYDCHNGPSGGALTLKTNYASRDQGFFNQLLSNARSYLIALRDKFAAMVKG